MKKTNHIASVVFIFLFFLTSCQSIKDGLSGRKSENSDEFLVQKKNPLVTPPDYMKLPKPKEISENEISNIEDETDIKKILEIDDLNKDVSQDKFKNAEEFVLKKIKE